MRAAVVHQADGSPVWESFPAPVAGAGQQLITVEMAALGSSEPMRVSNWAASYYGPFKGPSILGGEGVGRLASGQRVYFGHSIAPYGAAAEQTLVDEQEIWPIPESLENEFVLPLGISGTGALIPLEQARIQPGERVLILGATGPLGQIALQLARMMGAGDVVAAARRLEPLQRLLANGFADRVIQLGQGNDEQALKDGAAGGFDVVLDCVYGEPMVAALKATARGGRVLSISNIAGRLPAIDLKDLIFRTHAGVATGIRPAAERHDAFQRLLGYALEGHLKPVDTSIFAMADITQAWHCLLNHPQGKVLLRP